MAGQHLYALQAVAIPDLNKHKRIYYRVFEKNNNSIKGIFINDYEIKLCQLADD